MTHTFTLPGVTPSQNVYDRWHWSRKHTYRNDWFLTVLSVAGHAATPEYRPAKVKITRVAKRLIDLQNIGSPTKPLLDAFVFYRWLGGDSVKYVTEFTTCQRKCEKGEEPHMEIVLEF